MTITALPTPPSRDDPSNFASRGDAFMAALPTFATEANALAAGMSAAASGGAITIGYTFSPTTTDADPGAGYLRLDNATQNTATVIRADLADAAGTTWTAVLDTIDDSDSTVKGHIRLSKIGDGTKWLMFTVSAIATPSGYRNITVACIGSSAASPFADGDAVLLVFTRTGDKGATGATGATGAAGADGADGSPVLLSVVVADGSGATASVENTFDGTYDAYLIVGGGIAPGTDAQNLLCRLKIGGSYLSTSTYRYFSEVSSDADVTPDFVRGSAEAEIIIGQSAGNAAGSHSSIVMWVTNPASTTLKKTIQWTGTEIDSAGRLRSLRGAGGNDGTAALTGVRFYFGSGNIAGTFRLYGFQNS